MWFFFSISGGANNPFLQEDTTQQYSYTADGKRIEGNQDQYYGAGYSQAQSGYSSSGFGELRLDRFSPILWILRSTLIFFRSSIRQVRHSKAWMNIFCCQAYYETYPKIGKRQKWSWALTTPNSVHSIRCGLPTYSKIPNNHYYRFERTKKSILADEWKNIITTSWNLAHIPNLIVFSLICCILWCHKWLSKEKNRCILCTIVNCVTLSTMW